MILLPLTVICAMILGGVLGNPVSTPVQESARTSTPALHASPRAQSVNLQTEMSEPMFEGMVSTIDRATLHVTILTDFGRLVPVAVESCEIIQGLRIGDRVHLDVDAQGAVRVLGKTGASPAATSTPPTPSTWTPGRCPETST